MKIEVSQSRLQQSHGLTIIPFKSKLSDLCCEYVVRIGLCVCIFQQFSGFVQVTLGLINVHLRRHHIGIVWRNV